MHLIHLTLTSAVDSTSINIMMNEHVRRMKALRCTLQCNKPSCFISLTPVSVLRFPFLQPQFFTARCSILPPRNQYDSIFTYHYILLPIQFFRAILYFWHCLRRYIIFFCLLYLTIVFPHVCVTSSSHLLSFFFAYFFYSYYTWLPEIINPRPQKRKQYINKNAGSRKQMFLSYWNSAPQIDLQERGAAFLRVWCRLLYFLQGFVSYIRWFSAL